MNWISDPNDDGVCVSSRSDSQAEVMAVQPDLDLDDMYYIYDYTWEDWARNSASITVSSSSTGHLWPPILEPEFRAVVPATTNDTASTATTATATSSSGTASTTPSATSSLEPSTSTPPSTTSGSTEQEPTAAATQGDSDAHEAASDAMQLESETPQAPAVTLPETSSTGGDTTIEELLQSIDTQSNSLAAETSTAARESDVVLAVDDEQVESGTASTLPTSSHSLEHSGEDGSDGDDDIVVGQEEDDDDDDGDDERDDADDDISTSRVRVRAARSSTSSLASLNDDSMDLDAALKTSPPASPSNSDMGSPTADDTTPTQSNALGADYLSDGSSTSSSKKKKGSSSSSGNVSSKSSAHSRELRNLLADVKPSRPWVRTNSPKRERGSR